MHKKIFISLISLIPHQHAASVRPASYILYPAESLVIDLLTETWVSNEIKQKKVNFLTVLVKCSRTVVVSKILRIMGYSYQ